MKKFLYKLFIVTIQYTLVIFISDYISGVFSAFDIYLTKYEIMAGYAIVLILDYKYDRS